jgi:polyhydroxyalkanoate synthase subunit PhaC
MADQRGTDPGAEMAPEIGAALADIAERSGRIVRDFLEREAHNGHDRNTDPLDLGRAFFALTSRMMADPFKLAEAQINLWQN